MAKPKAEEAVTALTAALAELLELQAAYDVAQGKESAARRDATEAVNRLNAKQSEVERLLADLKNGSGGDWGMERHRVKA